MAVVFLALTVIVALLVTFSGIAKIRRDPRVVKVINETCGVPLTYFPVLAALEFAGALGLVAGVWWPVVGVAAGIGLVLYFVGAAVSHLRVGDVKGVGAAVFMLVLSGAVLAFRVLTMRA
jgi:hypothetical protein